MRSLVNRTERAQVLNAHYIYAIIFPNSPDMNIKFCVFLSLSINWLRHGGCDEFPTSLNRGIKSSSWVCLENRHWLVRGSNGRDLESLEHCMISRRPDIIQWLPTDLSQGCKTLIVSQVRKEEAHVTWHRYRDKSRRYPNENPTKNCIQGELEKREKFFFLAKTRKRENAKHTREQSQISIPMVSTLISILIVTCWWYGLLRLRRIVWLVILVIFICII